MSHGILHLPHGSGNNPDRSVRFSHLQPIVKKLRESLVTLTEKCEFFQKGFARDGEEAKVPTGRGQDQFVHVGHVDGIGDPHSCSTSVLSDTRRVATHAVVELLSSRINLLQNEIR